MLAQQQNPQIMPQMQIPQQFQPQAYPMYGMMPMQAPGPDPNALENAIFSVGESRDDKKRKEDVISKMKFATFSPQTGTNFIAQVRKQILIHNINPDDPDIKASKSLCLIAFGYSDHLRSI